MSNRFCCGFLVGTMLFCNANASAFALRDAISIYEEKFSKSPPSVQECGEYCFVIVEGDLAKARHGDVRPLVLSGELKAIQKYVGTPGLGYVSPFTTALQKMFSTLVEFEIPHCRTVTVEDSHDDRRFRHVTAYEAEPLQRARDRVERREKGRRSVAAWRRDLASLVSRYEKAHAVERVWNHLGATLPIVLGEDRFMSFAGIEMNGADVERLISTWNGDSADRAECVNALKVLPSFSRAHMRMAELESESGNYIASALEFVNAGAGGCFDRKKFADRIKEHERIWTSLSWREFGRLADALAIPDAELAKSRFSRWKDVVRTLGFVSFRNSASSEAEHAFAEARELFQQGKNLPRILSLLEESLTTNPGVGDAWRYYAAALRTSGRHRDSVLAGHVALVLNRSDEKAIWEIIRGYKELGLHEMAESNAWWLSVVSHDLSLQRCTLDFLKGMRPDCYD